MPTIQREFGDLYYRDSGKGRSSLILLHEYFGTGDSWAAQRQLFARYFRVIVPDLRGHGRSVMSHGRIRVSSIADDVLALQRQLELETSHLIGCSLGGVVALHLARTAPCHAGSVVVSSLPDIAHQGARDYAHGYIEDVFPRIERSLDRVHGEDRTGYSREVLLRNFALDLEEWPDDHLDASRRIAEVLQPLLVICGERDPAFPTERAVGLSSDAPRGALAVLPQAGHLVHQEMPGIFNELVLDHLQRSMNAV